MVMSRIAGHRGKTAAAVAFVLGCWEAFAVVGSRDVARSPIRSATIHWIAAPDTGISPMKWAYMPHGEAPDVGRTSPAPSSALEHACGAGAVVRFIRLGERALAWCGARVLLLATHPAGEQAAAPVLSSAILRPELRSRAHHPLAAIELSPDSLVLAWLSPDTRVVHVGCFDRRLRPTAPPATLASANEAGAVFLARRGRLLQVDASLVRGHADDLRPLWQPPRSSFLVDARGGAPRRVTRMARIRGGGGIAAALMTAALLVLAVSIVARRHRLVRALRGRGRSTVVTVAAEWSPDGTTSILTPAGVIRLTRSRARLYGVEGTALPAGPYTFVLASRDPPPSRQPYREQPADPPARPCPIVFRGKLAEALSLAKGLRTAALRQAAFWVGLAAVPLLLAMW